MDKVRVGVLGGARGRTMIHYCKMVGNAELVAVCDKYPEALDRVRNEYPDLDIAYYSDFEDFLQHDMDAVVLANYANEHAPFAIRCLERGLHVISEAMPVQNMKEAVELVEAVEKSGLIYSYAENYCYMGAVREMKKLYEEGVLGELEYAEGEYVHNCAPIWHDLTYGDPNHWRNNMFSTFYCTHSLGPIVHLTGLRPVSVTGYESAHNQRRLNVGCKGAEFGIEMVTLENSAIVRSLHGGLYRDQTWFSLYGSKGHMESARQIGYPDHSYDRSYNRIYIDVDSHEGANEKGKAITYRPDDRGDGANKGFGHGGSDYYPMYYFIERIRGDEKADIVDVYEAMDMCLPGLFAYRSILNGGQPMEVPNLRDPAVRDAYRNDTACTDPKAAKDQLLPTCKTGTPVIPDEVYEEQARKWQKTLEERRANYKQ